MAVLDNATGLEAPIFKTWGPRIIWWLFNETKDQSWKFRVGPVPVSIKVAKLRPLLEWWVGPEEKIVDADVSSPPHSA